MCCRAVVVLNKRPAADRSSCWHCANLCKPQHQSNRGMCKCHGPNGCPLPQPCRPFSAMTTSLGVSRRCAKRRDCPVRRSTDTWRGTSSLHAVASAPAGSRGWRQRYYLGCGAGLVLASLREILAHTSLVRSAHRVLRRTSYCQKPPRLDWTGRQDRGKVCEILSAVTQAWSASSRSVKPGWTGLS